MLKSGMPATGEPEARLPDRRGAQPARPRPTAATAIVSSLRRDILDLSLPPGFPLSEKALTDRFGTSRTPIREALIRLAEEGLVDIFPQAGTFVGRIPLDSLPEAIIVREALELAALRFAIARADEQDLRRVSAIIARQDAMARLDDREAFHDADEAFHEAIAVIAGHPGLWRVAHQAKSQIDRFRRLTLPVEGRMQLVVHEHTAILDAMRARDVGAAEAALSKHLLALIPDLESIRSEFPDYFV